MGADESKELPPDYVQNQPSVSGRRTNSASLLLSPADTGTQGPHEENDGSFVIYLGLKSNSSQFNDPDVRNKDTKQIQKLLDEFFDKIAPRDKQAEKEAKDEEQKKKKGIQEIKAIRLPREGYDSEMRDKAQPVIACTDTFVAQHFNDSCKEGYELLTNVLSKPYQESQTATYLQFHKMKRTALEILCVLFEDTCNGIEIFMSNKEAHLFLNNYLKSIVNNYKDNGETFETVMKMIQSVFKKAMTTLTFQCRFCKDKGFSLENHGCENCEMQRNIYANGVKFLFEKCKFIQNVCPILLDSDNIKSDESEDDKKRVIKSLFVLVEFLLDDERPENEVKVILEHIYKQQGLMANLILNLNQPQDDDPTILSAQMWIVGCMCQHLKKFQKSRFMIESGTSNLIYIMACREMSMEKHFLFKLKALVSIRKATSCKVAELLDAFVANGLIEELVAILDHFGKKRFADIEKKEHDKRTAEESAIREIQVQTLCIIIQLCYRAENIKKIEKLKALDQIKAMERSKFNKKKNREIYVNTVLQYCSENQSIRLQGPPTSFCKIICRKIDEMIHEDQDRRVDLYRIIYKSLSNLSLIKECHQVIFTVPNLKLLYNHINDFRSYILLSKDDFTFEEASNGKKDNKKRGKVGNQRSSVAYLKKHYLRFIYCVRIVTNCLVTPDILRCFDAPEFQEILGKYIEFFQFFHDWNTQKFHLFGEAAQEACVRFTNEIEKDLELSAFFQQMQDECSLALSLIFTEPIGIEREIILSNSPDDLIQKQETYKQIKYLLQLLKHHTKDCYDVHILSKALNIVSRFHCKTWRQTKLLYFSGILLSIKEIMSYAEVATTREASILCTLIMQNPDDMICWLKFGSHRLTTNSACTNDYMIQHGNPNRLPAERGLYRNWGAFFNFGDVIEIPGGLQIESIIMERWSISFWTILPMNNFDTQKSHVLVQSLDGKWSIQLDKTCSKLQVRCEKTQKIVTAMTDLTQYKKGWHNIIITCDNLDLPGGQGAVNFIIDGIKLGKTQPCICIQPIGYIGNSKNGSNPYGTFSDLRIFPYCIKKAQIELLSNYHQDLEFDMPDKYCSSFIEIGMVKLILDDLTKYARSDTKGNLLRVLLYLSTHRDCKAYILKYNCLEKAMDLIHDSDDLVKFTALNLIQTLV